MTYLMIVLSKKSKTFFCNSKTKYSKYQDFFIKIFLFIMIRMIFFSQTNLFSTAIDFTIPIAFANACLDQVVSVGRLVMLTFDNQLSACIDPMPCFL